MSKSIIDNNPVNVDIKVDGINITADAFSTICFITSNDEFKQRDTVVNKLEDLLDAGYTRDSKAYNFCFGVFLQGKLNNIIVRSKRKTESYIDAYLSSSNIGYYYLVLESKDIEDILSVQGVLSNRNDLKLLFFSSNKDYSGEVKGLSRLVYYYNSEIGVSVEEEDCWLIFEDGSSVTLDAGSCIGSEV